MLGNVVRLIAKKEETVIGVSVQATEDDWSLVASAGSGSDGDLAQARPSRMISTNSGVLAKMPSDHKKVGAASESALFENRIVKVQVSVPSPNDPFSEEEAAAYLKIHEDSLKYYALRAGEIAFCDLGKGRRTYLRKDLDNFLSRRREPSIDEKTRARPRRKEVER